MKIVLLGIGSSLRGDDGAGPAAVQAWMHAYPQSAVDPRIMVIQAASPGIEILTDMEDADAVVLVDAIQTGNRPGSVRVFDPVPDALPALPAEKSAHGFGVSQVLSLARQLKHPLPEKIILIGMEAGQFKIGRGLSHEISDNLPSAARTIEEILNKFLGKRPSQDEKTRL